LTPGATVAALSASFDDPESLAWDGNGNLYIADPGDQQIYRLSLVTGMLKSVAGNGAAGDPNNDGSYAVGSAIDLTQGAGLAVDPSAGLLWVDGGSGRLRNIDLSTGFLGTVAGSALGASAGDNGPAASAVFAGPGGLALSSDGHLFTFDAGELRRFSNCAKGGSYVNPYPVCKLGVTLSELRAGHAVGKGGFTASAPRAVAAPNPMAAGGGFLLVLPATGNADLALADLSGRLIWTRAMSGTSLWLPAPASPGIYFLQVHAQLRDGGRWDQLLKLAVVGRGD
jgi:hypothetical protein